MFSFGFNQYLGFGYQGSTVIQNLLSRDDLKLEDLLDEEAVTYEVKTQNQKLLDFLLDPENLKKLITYTIVEPELDELDFDQKKCYKYPYVCADLLSSECQPIANEFFKSKAELDEAERAEAERDKAIEKEYEEAEKAENQGDAASPAEKEDTAEKKTDLSTDKDKTVESHDLSEGDEVFKVKRENEELIYLAQLFGILNGKSLNLTCAGYFSKILNNLFVRKPAELLAYVYKTKKEVLDKLVDHISSKSIAELLAKLLTFESSNLDNPQDPVYNDERTRVLKLVLQKLEPSCDIEEINNSSYLICELFGKYGSMHGAQEVLGKILERPVIDSLFETLRLKSVLSSCAAALVLGNIFAYYILINTKTAEPPLDDVQIEVPHTIQRAELSSDIPLVAAFLDNIGFILDYINNPTSDEEVRTQFGTSIAPFGAARLKFLELLIISLKANNQDIYVKLAANNFFEILLDLIKRYEWNNMLHNQIDKIIDFTLDGSNDELKAALLDKAGLLTFLVNTSNEDATILKGKHERKVRKGYMGHIVKISNKVLTSKDPVVEKSIENNAAWKEYVETKLNEINNKYNVHLGGKDPRAVPEEIPGTGVKLELPSFMEKFSQFMNFQVKPEPKNLEEEVIDDEDIDSSKKTNIISDAVPKDEVVLLAEEKGPITGEDLGESALNEAAARGKSSAGVKVESKTGKEEEKEKEESGNVMWFSDPVTNSEDKKTSDTQAKNDQTGQNNLPDETAEKGEALEVNELHSVPKVEETLTAEDLLKGIEKTE